MGVRNLGELGLNLQNIISRLLVNDELVKLLYYANQDPLGQPALTKQEKAEKVFEDLIRIVPNLTLREDSRSAIAVYVARGAKISSNKEFRNITINIDCVVPLNTWIIKDSNLRPFAILGEIQKSLDGKTINKLGKLESGDFSLVDLTDENSVYRIVFNLTDYD